MIFKESDKQWMRKVSPFISVGVVIAMVFYCTYGDYRISNHWAKSEFKNCGQNMAGQMMEKKFRLLSISIRGMHLYIT